MARGKNRKWLKMDKPSKVRVRVGTNNVEVMLTFPAAPIRRQLERLK